MRSAVRTICCFILLAISCQLLRARDEPYQATWNQSFMSEWFWDVLEINKYLFTWDSYKVIVGFFPLYGAARMGDYDIHRHFYCRELHKNKHQPPRWCIKMCEIVTWAPTIPLGFAALVSKDDLFRTVCRAYIAGIPLVVSTKAILKHIDADFCWRPWNEHFDGHKRVCGGFPSGHMAEITFGAVLFGMSYGWVAAVPLAFIAGFVGGSYVVSNRHYLSQVVAGAGLGTLYALAAHKVVEQNILRHQDLDVELACDAHGGVGVCASYKF